MRRMKRTVRIVSLVLVLVMALSIGTVFASAAEAGATLYNVIPDKTTYSDCRILTFSADNVVPFKTGYVDGGSTAVCLFEGIDRLKLTFSPKVVTEDFMVFLLKARDNQAVDELVPGSIDGVPNIAYINQAKGAAKHEFEIYPSTLEKGASYGIYVSSASDKYKYVGSISVANTVTTVSWMLGDTNADKTIDSLDALWALKCFAESLGKTPTAEEITIADVNFDGTIDALDALQMLLRAAEKIDSFY